MIELRRLWLVFFTDGIRIKGYREILGPGIIARWLPRGWKHVCMASYYSEKNVWVCYDPARPCSYVLVLTGDEFDRVLERMLNKATSILEITSFTERRWSPTWASCTGQAKGMLGIRSWAMTPYQLHQALLARGAKRVFREEADAQVQADAASVPEQHLVR
jgi:hypothetical protein